MSGPTVFVTLQQFCERDPRPRQLLREAGFVVHENTLGRRLRGEELYALLQEADAVMAGVEPYEVALLSALPRLRCISRCGAGTDAIDLAAAHRLGIAVLTTPEEVVEPVAQMTMAMILALARHFPQHLRAFDRGEWIKRTGALLAEWTIGLVGFGRIGRAVEQYLRVFAPRVLIADPNLTVRDVPESVRLRSFDQLLQEADVVSLHAGRRREEGSLIGRRELSLMKTGSYLINTARGFLVDEADLYDALTSAHLAGAALDVFEAEPYQGPLARLPQVLCTPHVSTLTASTRAAMEYRSAQNLVAFFAQGATAMTKGVNA